MGEYTYKNQVDQQWDANNNMTDEYYKYCWLEAWADRNRKIYYHIYEVGHTNPIHGYYEVKGDDGNVYKGYRL